ncbi:MAG: SPASM domain-containing protein [Anaerolineae bacterium]|nr:SPASM domain-containing protein [Anaerolineae bacterium]
MIKVNYPHEVIVETVKACNLRCNYCYINHSRPFDVGALQILSAEVLDRFVPEFLEYSGSFARFDWHGGEPLLAGIDFYQHAIQLQREHVRPGQRISNVIQTNATLINAQWIEFFKSNDFRVGVSLDGPEWLQDKHRQSISGRGSSRRVMKGIELLLEHEVDISALAVVTEDSVGHEEEIIANFASLGIKRIDFLPCTVVSEDRNHLLPPSVSDTSYGKFLVKSYDVWRSGKYDVSIRTFDIVHAGLLRRRLSVCQYAGACHQIVALDFDGSIYPCGRYVGQTGKKFGNVLSENYDRIIQGSQAQNHTDELERYRVNCRECKWYSICHGGCPAYIVLGDNGSKESQCEARQMLFAHAYESLGSYIEANNLTNEWQLLSI